MTMRFRILIVDDEPINVHLLEKALSDEYDIFPAFNGYDAIRLVKEKHPDLILLDVMMPELSGFDVCKIIKSDDMFADIPILFLTAMESIAGEMLALELGGIDYLTKPINFDLLKFRVRNHIELRKRNNLIIEQRDLLIRQNEELEASLARVKCLEGIIPICMHCKSIRSDDASWQQLESYFSAHSDALFSHGICPDCLAQHYPMIVVH